MSELVGICLAVGSLLIIALLLRRALFTYQIKHAQQVIDPNDFSLSGLVVQLGNPNERQQARNRILAIGHRIIPELVEELVYHRFHVDSAPPTLLSELEGLIADFGPSAIEPISQRLARWDSTHRCAPAMVRIIESLGDDHFHLLLRSPHPIHLTAKTEKRFLNHLLLRRSDARTCNLLHLNHSQCPADELLVTIQSREWATLWLRLSMEGQSGLLNWLCDWPNRLDVSFIEFLLMQSEEMHLCQVLRLVSLNPHPRLEDLVNTLCRHDEDEVRRAALLTRSHFHHRTDASIFEPFLVANSRHERLLAVRGCILAGIDASNHSNCLQVIQQDLLWTDSDNTQTLAEQLYQKLSQKRANSEFSECELIAILYARFESERTVAYERLLALSGAQNEVIRVAATSALTVGGDQRAPEALKRCLQGLPSDRFKLPLQIIASQIGAAVAPIIARRLLGKGYRRATPDPGLVYGSHGQVLLALLRASPFATATEILLELIEADGQNPIASLLALTLKSGGRSVRKEVARALIQPERGLVLPAVRYLSISPDPLLIDELLHVYSNFDVVRTQILTVIEYLGPVGLEAIRTHIEDGGDDRQLDPLIETESWFQHCIDETR